MFKFLEEIIKKIEGNVLVLCLDDKLLDKFEKNNKVNLYAIYSSKNSSAIFSKNKKKQTNKGKTINIKKLRKYINKNSIDYLICNMDEIKEYYKYIIKDTIYLNKGTIYIYASNDIDKDFIINKYKRYNVKIKHNDYKNGYILTIDNKNSKNNYFKDKLYFVKDTFYNIAEVIGNIMVS
ncbi:MAG: hypothetical protein IJE04_02840 [Bacilli bacterium]|nr:hypothetical protein [Bacilli bacterium]